MYLNFAWRYFKGKKSANAINIISWVTTGVIAFATCCQVLVLSVFNGFEGLVRSLYSSFYSDLKIVPAKGKTILITGEQIEQVKQQPGISGLSLIAEEKALLRNGDAQSVVNIKGVDDNFSRVSGVPSKLTKGSFKTGTTDNPELVIGAGVQYAAGITVAEAFAPDMLTLILPKKTTANADPYQSLSEGNATASAVFAIQEDFDNKYAISNIGFVKQQMGLAEHEYTAAEIKLKNVAETNMVKEALQKLLGNNYLVKTKYEQNSNLYNTMRLEKWAIYAVLTLILIIAAFNMVSALTMLVLEKKAGYRNPEKHGKPVFHDKPDISFGRHAAGRYRCHYRNWAGNHHLLAAGKIQTDQIAGRHIFNRLFSGETGSNRFLTGSRNSNGYRHTGKLVPGI